MAGILEAGASLLLLASLIAAPALHPFGVAEATLILALLSVSAFGFIILLARHRVSLPERCGTLLVTLVMYLSSFLLSAYIGILNGQSAADVIRSTAPYVGVFLLLGPWLLLRYRVNVMGLWALFIIVGLVQCTYLIYLFATGTTSFDAESVRLGRTTLMDARTTVPLFLCAAILPVVFMVDRRARKQLVFLSVGIIFLATVAALSTQTRSQLISIVVGLGSFFGIYFFGKRSPSSRSKIAVFATTLLLVAGGTALLLLTPVLGTLIDVLLIRHATRGDGGRLAEWIPAITMVIAEGPSGWLFGVGAGRSFRTLMGDYRTYVHNFVVYLVLYNGILGVVAAFGFFAALVVKLYGRWKRGEGDIYLGAIALLAGLLTYAEFFAVHKLLSFNILLFAIFVIATGPTQVRRTTTSQIGGAHVRAEPSPEGQA